MPDWTRLTDEPFFSADGHIITALGSEAELIAMGDGLHNGLGNKDSQVAKNMRADYMDMALKGKFQVVQVNAPDGKLVATARLYVADAATEPKVGIRFLRGFNNVAVGGDNPASQAVADYISSVNSGATPSSIADGRFPVTQVAEVAVEAAPAKPAAPANAYQAAMEYARAYNAKEADVSKHITPIIALSKGLAKFNPQVAQTAQAAPVAKETLDQEFITPVASASYGNFQAVPVASKSALKELGGELENQYIFAHKVEEGVRFAKKGDYMVAAILLNGSPMGMAEYSIRNGSVTLEALTGYAQETITGGPYARAAVLFARDLTAGTVPGQTMFPVGNGFSAEPGDDFELSGPAKGGAIPYAQPLFRDLGAGVVDGGFDGEENNANDENDEDEEVPYEAPAPETIEWTPLVDQSYYADNGLRIDVLSSQKELQEMGKAMSNPLVNDFVAKRYADMAVSGEAQHYVVYDTNDQAVGCGCLLAYDSSVTIMGTLGGYPVKPYGRNNGEPKASVNIAVSEFASAINQGHIESIEIAANRFKQVEPGHKFGM